jgi:hypothetical protein
VGAEDAFEKEGVTSVNGASDADGRVDPGGEWKLLSDFTSFGDRRQGLRLVEAHMMGEQSSAGGLTRVMACCAVGCFGVTPRAREC